MLTEKIKEYLEGNADKILPQYEKDYKKRLEELGFSQKKNSSFIEFMSVYSDEYYGSEGALIDFMLDIKQFDKSQTMILRKYDKINSKFFSLLISESDDYLLYNKDDDSVKLIEAQNMKQLSNDDYYDKKWNSFNNFLEDFFELN
ncbi:hypothetical protein HER15_11165 [Tenacibaculum mesophilum]|uniref:SMI1/KNR4 family protein n=1 Tax=Tenacibaculum mesophilum TaxID=104268 RepID=A0AAE9MPW9_9FLAO|nr:hypothetical protein [Tenacibaculum mesophilum]UTD15999.1 hypothetical protein HER15_11165 [Tenacibaculum mesophilum]